MRNLFISIGLLPATLLCAQNLVPNPSFEEFTQCPTNWGQVGRLDSWYSAFASPDYFNACNVNGNDSVGVPLSSMGYQQAFDGAGYIGVVTYTGQSDGPYYREYVQCELNTPLTMGVPVYVSFKASTGGYGWDHMNSSMQYASSGIAVKFSTHPIITEGLWPGNIALELTSILNDTSSWISVQGLYTPDSAYSYLTIGSFKSDPELLSEPFEQDGQWPVAYAFVDGICVSEDPGDCPFHLGIDEVRTSITALGENPVGDDLQLRLNRELGEQANVQVFDAVGRLCIQRQVPSGARSFALSLRDLPSGSFYVRISGMGRQSAPIHIIHLSP